MRVAGSVAYKITAPPALVLDVDQTAFPLSIASFYIEVIDDPAGTMNRARTAVRFFDSETPDVLHKALHNNFVTRSHGPFDLFNGGTRRARLDRSRQQEGF